MSLVSFHLMKESTTPPPIQVPVKSVNIYDHAQQLAEENFQLHQIINDQTNTIDKLTNTVATLKELIQQLRDEIAILKGQKPKPIIAPSQLEGQKKKADWCARFQRNYKEEKPILFTLWVKRIDDCTTTSAQFCFSAVADATTSLQTSACNISRLARLAITNANRKKKRGQPRGKPRKKKKTVLTIHEKIVLQPTHIPEGAEFKGYKPYTVQDIIFQPHNTQYLMARWRLPDGSYITGELPEGIHGHYGPTLVAYILHQYHASRVTEPLLFEALLERGVLISAGKLNNILIEDKDSFHEEVDELLPAGVEADGQVQADDTGGRHQGQNQYTTVIGNRWFSFFTTTESKSRVNFFKLLQQGREEYLINEDTVEYLREAGVASYFPGYIALSMGSKFTTLAGWEQFLKEQNITSASEVRFLTEAALFASVILRGIPRNLGVHGDDAGQFDAFIRSLCWIHEERHYRKLIMTTDQARADLERIRAQIWAIYRKLKAYKESPNEADKAAIEKEFDDIFQQTTSSPTLNHQLKKTYGKNKNCSGFFKDQKPLYTITAAKRMLVPLKQNSRFQEVLAVRLAEMPETHF